MERKERNCWHDIWGSSCRSFIKFDLIRSRSYHIGQHSGGVEGNASEGKRVLLKTIIDTTSKKQISSSSNTKTSIQIVFRLDSILSLDNRSTRSISLTNIFNIPFLIFRSEE